MNTFTKIAVATIILGVAYVAITSGYDKSMIVHCTTLQNQAVENAENPNYFISQLDHDECLNVYKIDIDAPIK